jgi:hypothetical protein
MKSDRPRKPVLNSELAPRVTAPPGIVSVAQAGAMLADEAEVYLADREENGRQHRS